MSLTLVLGGARSGKTSYALTEAGKRPAERRVMVATAEALDAEMAERIARHRAERGDAWATIETPRELAAAVRGLRAGEVAVIDCLTLWLSNLMLAEADLGAAVADLALALSASPA